MMQVAILRIPSIRNGIKSQTFLVLGESSHKHLYISGLGPNLPHSFKNNFSVSGAVKMMIDSIF